MKLEGFVCLPSSAQVGDEGWRQVDRTNRPQLYCTGGFGRVQRLVEGVEHRVRHIALFSSVLHGSVGAAFEIQLRGVCVHPVAHPRGGISEGADDFEESSVSYIFSDEYSTSTPVIRLCYSAIIIHKIYSSLIVSSQQWSPICLINTIV